MRQQLAKAEQQVDIEIIHEDFDEASFAAALIRRLKDVPTGNDHANAFHTLIKGTLEFLFWPSLTNPEKEKEIHEGRKRIDIIYTNAADSGFFYSILKSPQTRALCVVIECKNYTEDPANPEFDQISGRFDHTRGHFGLLIFRNTNNYDMLLRRCRDTALDGRGYVLPLGDDQLVEMLEDVANKERARIAQRLDALFGRILA